MRNLFSKCTTGYYSTFKQFGFKGSLHIAYIDKKLEEHKDAMAKADNDREKAKHQKQIDKHNNQRQRYQEINKKLKENTIITALN